MTILPWQHEIWQSLWSRQQRDRMPHALLFSGVEGVGKMQFAQALAAAMLCNRPGENGQTCNQCKSCHLLAAQSHPDFMQVIPEEKGQIIKIDQIREVVNFVNGTALMGGYRVIILNPASAMNVYAANALLKTLEEPTPKTLLILICNQGARLLPTIASRCQRMSFHLPEKKSALQWLRAQQHEAKTDLELILSLANGAPLQAKAFLENDILPLRNDLYQGLLELSQQRSDPLQKAAAWQEQNMAALLYWLLTWLQDLLRCKVTENQAALINADRKTDLINLTQRISLESLLKFIDRVQATYARTLGSLNLNRQLLLEEILVEWKLCF